MTHYRNPETAPRDGTIIVGLFERRGKRAKTMMAAFDLDAAETIRPAQSDAQWVKDAAAEHAARLAADPTMFFRPLSDSDAAMDCGRLIGWRPARAHAPKDTTHGT